jgi:hypothetical protein
MNTPVDPKNASNPNTGFQPVVLVNGEPIAMRLDSVANRIGNLIDLAERLERVERGEAPICANYYQGLVRHLLRALSQDLPAALVEAVLVGRPATAALHENMHYAGWGLSRSPLVRAIDSRAQATRLIARLTAPQGPNA